MGKKNRISNRGEIARLCNSEWKVSCFQFQIRCVKNQFRQLRYVISVSKKVCKKAVVRNKIKRQVRSFFDRCVNCDRIKLDATDFYVKIKKGFLENNYLHNFLAFKKAVEILMNKTAIVSPKQLLKE